MNVSLRYSKVFNEPQKYLEMNRSGWNSKMHSEYCIRTIFLTI